MMDPENKPNNTTETENLSDGKLENISGGDIKLLDGILPRPDENSDHQFEKELTPFEKELKPFEKELKPFEKELTPCFPKSKPW